jgi:non-heme chloroperoxidase
MTGAAMARSSQTGDGHDMDHYADDLAALTEHLDLKNAVHVGHSTGGGEVVHYIGRHGERRVAKAAIIAAISAADGEDAGQSGRPAQGRLRRTSGAARRQPRPVLLRPAGRAVLRLQPARRQTFSGRDLELVAQGMMGGAKAHYDGIVAFSQTDFTEDLKKITVPVLVMHGDDDQIVPYADSAPCRRSC